MIEKGGDWDRRNRLKVYEGLFLISKRQFKPASNLLLDTLATFTSTEVMEYKDFVRYAILTAALTLDRVEFKQKVLIILSLGTGFTRSVGMYSFDSAFG